MLKGMIDAARDVRDSARYITIGSYWPPHPTERERIFDTNDIEGPPCTTVSCLFRLLRFSWISTAVVGKIHTFRLS